MKIRSITYFCNPKYPLEEKILQKAGKFPADAKSAEHNEISKLDSNRNFLNTGGLDTPRHASTSLALRSAQQGYSTTDG